MTAAAAAPAFSQQQHFGHNSHQHTGFGLAPQLQPHHSTMHQQFQFPAGVTGTLPLSSSSAVEIQNQNRQYSRRLSTNPGYPLRQSVSGNSLSLHATAGAMSWRNSLGTSFNGYKHSAAGQQFFGELARSLTSGSFKDLPPVETEFCRDFQCCGMMLNDLHELVHHWEEKHQNEGMQMDQDMMAVAAGVSDMVLDEDEEFDGLEGGNGMATEGDEVEFFLGGGMPDDVTEEFRSVASQKPPLHAPSMPLYVPTTIAQAHSRFATPSVIERAPSGAFRGGQGFLSRTLTPFYPAEDISHAGLMDSHHMSGPDVGGIGVDYGGNGSHNHDVEPDIPPSPPDATPVPASPPVGIAPALVEAGMSSETGRPFARPPSPGRIAEDSDARGGVGRATPPLPIPEGGVRRSARHRARSPKIVVDEEEVAEMDEEEVDDDSVLDVVDTTPKRTRRAAMRTGADGKAVSRVPESKPTPRPEESDDEDDEEDDYDEDDGELEMEGVQARPAQGAPAPKAPRVVRRNISTNEDEEYIMEGRGIVKGVKGDRKYICAHAGCDKVYKNPGGLKYHLAHGHPDPTKSTIPPGLLGRNGKRGRNVPDIYKPYKCCIEVCGKRYKNLNGLKYHLEHHHPDEVPLTTDKEGRPKWDLSSCYDPLISPPPAPVPLPATTEDYVRETPAMSAARGGAHGTSGSSRQTATSSVRSAQSNPRSSAASRSAASGSRSGGQTQSGRTAASAESKSAVSQSQSQQTAAALQLQKAAAQLFTHFQQQFQSNPQAAAALLSQQQALLVQLGSNPSTPGSTTSSSSGGSPSHNIQQLFADASAVIAKAQVGHGEGGLGSVDLSELKKQLALAQGQAPSQGGAKRW